MGTEDDRAATGDRVVSRRRMLALSASGFAASVAGCGQSGDADGTSTTPTTTTTTGGGTTTTAPTTTAAPEDRSIDPSIFEDSPGAHHGPADGFATLDWLGDFDFEVKRVTNLEKEGEGSLKRAVSGLGARLVVFEVGGVIDLEGDTIAINRPNCFVAGQTAPSPGITVIRGNVLAKGYNVFVQHLRVRPGDRLFPGPRTGEPGGAPVDAMSSPQSVSNVLFDHCSTTWGSDETMSTGGGFQAQNISYSNNIIAECLNESVHPKGAHSYGTLIMNNAGPVSMMGNLWAHNRGRNPRLKGGTTSAVVNNVAYNFGYAVMMGAGSETPTRSTIVGNVYLDGEDTDAGRPIVTAAGDTPPEAYAVDNLTEPTSQMLDGEVVPLQTRPVWTDTLQPMPASETLSATLESAGARPADRTHHDERVVGTVRDRTGGIVDRQTEVGGYPELEATERSLDVPEGDLTEWIRQHTRAVELPDASPP